MLEDFKLSDLKEMSYPELDNLAQEIREKIINVTSVNGGHLASNLGVVELTIALHKVFDSPKDKIIFDVSHQMYTHKILTGRLDQFDTLRKLDGLSGFSKRSESVHDAFEAGHSSTSLSAGLGFLEAKEEFPDQIGEVIAVIGDASIANGLCFEALNYLGAKKNKKMIIIINDNHMSISKNVGALAKKYNSLRIKNSMKGLRKIIPLRIKHALQYYAYKVDLFTSMGFKYFENIDGHSISELCKYLNFAKASPKTIVLHINTTKGKGYAPAEHDKAGLWHGVSSFNIEDGSFKNVPENEIFGEILAKQLIKLSNEKDGNLIRVICPAMILGTGIMEYAKTFPRQTIDVGIAEENALLMASSMAIAGLKPVVFVYATFLQRAYDELMHDIARSNTHVVICVDHAGIVSSDGDTHQGIYDLAMYSSIPGITVLSPSTKNDTIKMIDYALNCLDGPVIIRYPKGEVKAQIDTFTDSLSWKVIKEGKNYIITYGEAVDEVLDLINNNNLDLGLISASVISPLDEDLIDNLKNTDTLYLYEEVISTGSLANRLLSYVNKKGLNIKIKSVALDDCYIPQGSTNELKERYHITINDLLLLIKEGKSNVN